MRRFDAVLFDWMVTLAHYPSPRAHLELALANLGRTATLAEIEDMLAAQDRAKLRPEVEEASAIEDTSLAAHGRSERLLYERSGYDQELADALYILLGQASFHPAYPDAAPTIRSVKAAGLQVGVLSDIHVDLRKHAAEFGFGDDIDSWSLSFELGVQKPALEIFEHAFAQLDCPPERILMVGDTPVKDGAASLLGATALLLPRPASFGVRGLDLVLAMID